MSKDDEYLESLQLLITEYQLENKVHLVGFVPHNKLAQYYRDSSIVVGLTPDGGVDKTILEAMASGCLILTSNTINKKYFGNYDNKLIFGYRDSGSLADKIISLNQLSSENKKEISDFLVQSVSGNHKLQNLINKLYSLYV
jgi:glycosyltransferase involved in cell wall biosynthesis